MELGVQSIYQYKCVPLRLALVTFITTTGGLCMRAQLFFFILSFFLSRKLKQTKLHSLNLRWLKLQLDSECIHAEKTLIAEG